MANNPRLMFVVPGDDPPQIQGSPHLDRLKSYGKVVLHTDRPSSFEDQLNRVKDAHVLINTRGSVRWQEPILRKLPKLRMITTCSIGTDMIDLTAATDLGIVVSNQPGRTAKVVAEHLMGLLFAVAKRTAFQTSELKAGRWGRKENVFLQGKTIGIIGTGNIGGEMARLANALGMRVIAWTFNPTPERASNINLEYVELDDLLTTADVISLHVALSETTRHIIGPREFSLMGEGTLFINGGRGELVDTMALVNALNSSHLGGAALDVFDPEPLPNDHPLLGCEQVVLTPHMGDQTPEGIELLNEGAIDNIIAFLKGHPQNVVSL